MKRRFVVIVVLVLLALAAGTVAAAEYSREFTFATDNLKVVNMIGTIDVVETDGDAFLVQVVVRGADASEDILEFTTLDSDGDVLAIGFPIKEHKKYIYPPLGRGSKTTMHFHNEGDHGKSWLKKVFSGMTGTKVTVQGHGNGQEVWADVTISVPRRASLEVRHGVGGIQANDLQADLDLDINAGGIEMRGVRGDVLADTGSGRVVATGIVGEVNIDTGSGSVEVRDCEGSDIRVDTGSGGVVAGGLKCDYLLIDTGSGSVKARQVDTNRATIDTGSGSVVLQLARMGDGKFVIDTGSGNIDLVMPADASARISADTGSGSISNEFPGADVVKKERGEMELVVGDGETLVRLDAGSGSITVGRQ